MRIITGSAKGIALQTLEGETTRPTSARAKEALFSMLQFDLAGRRVLDLFGGSGQLGLEALSRGAAACVFVDTSPAAAAVIRRNVEKTGFSALAQVQNTDYRNYLRKYSGEGFDLVFLDPPYASDALADALVRLADSGLLHRGCLLACESETGGIAGKHARIAEAYTTLKSSHYGRVHIEILTPNSQLCAR